MQHTTEWINWRRRQAVYMRDNGATYREIGQFFGVSESRASSIVSAGKRQRRDWKVPNDWKARRVWESALGLDKTPEEIEDEFNRPVMSPRKMDASKAEECLKRVLARRGSRAS